MRREILFAMPTQVAIGEQIQIRLHRGRLTTEVKDKNS